MPTYEYACQSCGHRFETFQSIKADPLSDCPSCEAAALRRVIGSGAGIIFKGSGFYQTDYRKETGKGEASDGASSENDKNENKAKPESTSSAKGESSSVTSASKD